MQWRPLVLVVVLAASGCIGGAPAEPRAEPDQVVDPDQGDGAVQWNLSVPDPLDAVAFQLRVPDADEETCDVKFNSVKGVTDRTAAPFVHAMGGVPFHAITFSNPMVFADGNGVDSRDLFDLTYGYSSTWLNLTGDPPRTTVAAVDVQSVDDESVHPGEPPLSVSLRCSTPVDVEAWAGTDEVHLFSDEELESTASAREHLTPVPGGDTHAVVQGSFSATTSEDRTLAMVRADGPESPASAGEVTLETPDGSQAREFGLSKVDPIHVEEGSPGEYSVEMTRASVEGPIVHGFVAGVSPVADSVEGLEEWLVDQAGSR